MIPKPKRKVPDPDNVKTTKRRRKLTKKHNNETCDDGKTTNDPDESLDEENIVSKITSVIQKPKHKVLHSDPDNVKTTKKSTIIKRAMMVKRPMIRVKVMMGVLISIRRKDQKVSHLLFL